MQRYELLPYQQNQPTLFSADTPIFHLFPAFGSHPCCQLWVQSARSSRWWSFCIFVIFVVKNRLLYRRLALSIALLSWKFTQSRTPRNITHARPRLLKIAANECLRECCEVLTRFGFRGKMYYLCISEEERALNTGFSPLFLATRSYICASLRFSSFYGTGSRMLENLCARFFNYANLWSSSCLRAVTSPAPCALCHRSSAGWPRHAACHWLACHSGRSSRQWQEQPCLPPVILCQWA